MQGVGRPHVFLDQAAVAEAHQVGLAEGEAAVRRGHALDLCGVVRLVESMTLLTDVARAA